MGVRQQLIVSGILVCLGLGGLGACRQPSPDATGIVTEAEGQNESKLKVTVSILPQQYFVEKIGGDRVAVQVMVPEGAEAEIYEPKPQQLAALSTADAYIATGILFEDIWAERIKTANGEMLLADSSVGIDKLAMVAHAHHHGDHSDAGHQDKHDAHADHADHDHGKHKDEHQGHDHEDHDDHSEPKDEHQGHDHGEHKEHKDHENHDEHQGHDNHAGHGDHGDDLEDPHTWLSPQLAKVHAENIYDVLVELDPDSEALFKENLDSFLAEIDQVDQAIATELADLPTRAFLVFHPAWSYFAEDYNLEQIPIEVAGQEPSAAELAELIKVAQAEDIRVIFAQYQFNSQAAATIAQEINAEIVYIDPLSADWANNLQAIAKQIAQASRP